MIVNDENKYHYYYKNLNIRPYENIYSLTEKNDMIIELDIKNPINAIVDNFDNFVCPVLPLPFVIRQSIICRADKRWAARD